MAGPALIPAGYFRTSYAADTTIFPTTTSRNFAIIGVLLLCLVPQLLGGYWLSILIQIGIFSIAALGLNILVGFTGQISIGHAAFFGFGAFTSAYLSNRFGIPVFFCIPLAGSEDADRASLRVTSRTHVPEPVQGWEQWAKDIGADAYGANAGSAVPLARRLVGK